MLYCPNNRPTSLTAAGYAKRSMWDLLCHPDDCSVARGLAVAASRHLRALQFSTVRRSERSPEEIGDNIVFGHKGTQVAHLSIDRAYLFPLAGAPIVCPVEFGPNIWTVMRSVTRILFSLCPAAEPEAVARAAILSSDFWLLTSISRRDIKGEALG